MGAHSDGGAVTYNQVMYSASEGFVSFVVTVK